MKKINNLIFVLFLVLFASCEQEYTKEYNWAYPLSGEWTMKEYDANGVAQTKAFPLKVYNSSKGQDSIWIDDYATNGSNGKYWSMKFKAKADIPSKTFKTDLSTSIVSGYNIGIKVLNGKVIGNDSIYFEIQFEDDSPAFATHILAGHRATSYEEYMSH